MIGAMLSVLAVSAVMVMPSAAATEPALTPEQADARYAAYRERINQLLEAGKTQAEVDSAIAAEFDIIRLDIGGVDAVDASVGDLLATGGSDVLLYKPTFSYDRFTGWYVMAASWVWKVCADIDNRACWTKDKSGYGAMGGPDGMAVKINRPIDRQVAGFSTSDNCGNPALYTKQAATDNGYGVGFVAQDSVDYGGSGLCAGTKKRYDWHRGTVSESFTFDNPRCGGVKLQIDSKFGHTWETTAVDSIGISTTGISISWSSSHHRWSVIPASPAYAYC